MRIELPKSPSPNRFEHHKRGFYKAYSKYDQTLGEIIKQTPGVRGQKDKSGFYWEMPMDMAPKFAELVMTYLGRPMEFPETRVQGRASFYDKLHPHQQKYVRLVHAQGTGWAWFKPGLGKSAAALAARIGDTTLIVCPAKVRRTWADQIAEWLPGRSCYVHKPGPKGWLYDGEEFMVVSYEMLPKVIDKMPARVWNVIFDEGHYLKSYQSERTQAAAAFIAAHPEALPQGLTATIAPDNLADIYQPIHTLTPWRLGKPSSFRERYFEIEKHKFAPGGIIRGIRDDTIGELTDRMSGIGVTATQEECGHLMPPIITKVVHIEEHWTAEEALASQERLDRYIATEDETILEQHTQATTAIKEEAALAYVKELIADGHEKIAVVTYNRDVAESLHRSFQQLKQVPHESTLVMGGMPDRDARIVKAASLQHSLLDATMDSIKEGLNSLVVFDQIILVQLYWSPASVAQLIGRFNRLTSKKPTCVHVLQLDGTLDEVIARALKKKNDEINTVIKAGAGEQAIAAMTEPKAFDWQASLRDAIGD